MATGSARDLARLYRIRDWLHFLPLPLAGWYTAGAWDPRTLVGGVLGWGLALAYTSALNQAFDDSVDRAQAGKNPVGRSFDRRRAVGLAVPPAVAAVTVVALLAPAGMPALAVLLAAGTIYSAPPRLKSVPIVGTLWNLLIGLPGLVLAERPEIGRQPLRLLFGLFALLLLISQLLHEAGDREDDHIGGIRTVATVAGAKGALAAAAIVLLCTPAAVWCLAGGVTSRLAMTIAAAVFAVTWAWILLRRIVHDDGVALRRLRLRYRSAAFALGAVAFVSVALS